MLVNNECERVNNTDKNDYEDDYNYYDEIIGKNVNEEDDCEEIICSTIPTPTYNKNNRLDYVAMMRDYNSGDERLRDKASEKIVMDLTGLVLYIIKKKYANYSPRYYDDLVQSGEIGILTGLKDYDPKKSLPATYFYYFIVHEIQSFINSNIYKTTPYYSANMKKINRAIAEFENANQAFTRKDISIQTGIPLDTVEKVMNMMIGRSEVSLTSFGEQLEGAVVLNPEEEFFKKENCEYLYKVMRDALTREEVLVISHMYGIGGIESLSLKAIAQKYGMPIDKVKRLKITAFCKLRNSALSRIYPQGYKNDLLELEEEDSISLFPSKQASDSAEELKEMEIEF